MIIAGVPAISCCLVWPHLHTPSEQSGEEPANVIRLLEEAGGGEVGVIEWEVGVIEWEVGVIEWEVGVNEWEVGVSEWEVGVIEWKVGGHRVGSKGH